MKIEQWVEQRYAWFDGSSNHDEQSLDGYAFVRMDKAIEELKRVGLNAIGLQLSDARKHCLQQGSRNLIDLNFVLRSVAMSGNTARELLRKLIVWCAVYNEVV